jgi:hypothetical protein
LNPRRVLTMLNRFNPLNRSNGVKPSNRAANSRYVQ